MAQPQNSNNNGISDASLVQAPAPARMNFIYRFFCWCSGAELSVLAGYPTEHNRYFGIGTAVFMTGVFAFISSSYAVSWVFQDAQGETQYYLAIPFGIAWASFIFFLDRYFVASMSKSDNKWQEFFIALPRLIIAVFIGIVVSHPLELRLFQSELQDYLSTKRDLEVRKVDSTYNVLIQAKERKIDTIARTYYSQEGREVMRLDSLIQNERIARETRVKPIRDSVQCECNGACGTMLRGKGPACQTWERELSRLIAESDTQIKSWQKEKADKKAVADLAKAKEDTFRQKDMATVRGEISQLDSTRMARKKQKEKEFSKSILAQTTALAELSAKESGVSGMQWVIIILFILLEISPILVKLLSKTGPYDQRIQDLEYGYTSESLTNRFLVREELKTNKGLINQMGMSQRDLVKQAMDRWKEEQSDLMNENFEEWMNSNSPNQNQQQPPQ